MKTPTHVKQPAIPARSYIARLAFTLIELLVVITIIAILAGIALPVFSSVQIKANQAKALSNAKQIALALRLSATDNNGIYPSYTLLNGQPTTTTVGFSNIAFAQLFPNYVQEETIFYVAKSAWTPAPPDEVTDNPPLDTPVNTLKAGENEWAYVLQLNDSANPAVPLIADGFASASTHTYTTVQSLQGGVWKGQKSIVVHADSSGDIVNVSAGSTPPYTVVGPNGGGAVQGDVFTTGNGNNGWLSSGNIVVNPE